MDPSIRARILVISDRAMFGTLKVLRLVLVPFQGTRLSKLTRRPPIKGCHIRQAPCQFSMLGAKKARRSRTQVHEILIRGDQRNNTKRRTKIQRQTRRRPSSPQAASVARAIMEERTQSAVVKLRIGRGPRPRQGPHRRSAAGPLRFGYCRHGVWAQSAPNLHTRTLESSLQGARHTSAT